MSQANFPAHNLIFTEGEGDGIKSGLSSEIFFTLPPSASNWVAFCPVPTQSVLFKTISGSHTVQGKTLWHEAMR